MSVPDIGAIISSAMVAAIGNGDAFSKGRNFAAWLGPVPKQISTAESDAAFAALLRERVGGLAVAFDPFFDTRRASIIAFVAKNRLPAIYHFREYASDGGLISYGPSITDSYRQVGVYAGRILSGVKPTDMSVLGAHKVRFRNQPQDCESARARNSTYHQRERG